MTFEGIVIGCCSGRSVTEEPRRALVKVDGVSDHIHGVLTFEQASSSSPVKVSYVKNDVGIYQFCTFRLGF